MKAPLASLLNAPQLEAATHPSGPVCIIAGAGSGKTRVITHRLAWLVDQGVAHPEECLAVTFTNKAARELRERVDAVLPGVGHRLWVSTFHSAAARILREAHQVLDLPRGFTIYDQDDAERLIKQICDELNVATDLIRTICHRIEQLEHQAVTPEKFTPEPFDIPAKRVAQVYPLYLQRLKSAGAVDFGGLIVMANQVIRHHPEASHSLRRILHAVVDEYQDVNGAQALMVEGLAPRLKSLAVVGDDDQSIYRWRGASAYSLLRFTETFKAARLVRLEQNYRSTSRILEVANHVIRSNPGRLGKELWTDAGPGGPIVVRRLRSERDEADYVVQETLRYLATGKSANDVAVLYRTNAQSRGFEEALHRAQVPYRLVGALRFYERREVKDVLAYLRLVVNPDSEMDLRRIINVPPRAIGDKTVERLGAAAQQHGVSLPAATQLSDMQLAEVGLKAAGRGKVREFGRLMAEIRAAAAEQPPGLALTEIVARTLYDQYLHQDEDGEDRLENLQSLYRAAGDYEEDSRAAGNTPTLTEFLERASLTSETDQGGTSDAVTLMTLHAAKGLEFSSVFLVGLEENMLPGSRALNSDDPEDLLEERRLCYVGMTRARHRLVLTMTERRMIYGEYRFGEPSRFLTELAPEVIREHMAGDIAALLPKTPMRAAWQADLARPGIPRTVDRGQTRVVYDSPPPRPRRSPVVASRMDVVDVDLDAEDVLMDDGGVFRAGSRVKHPMHGQGTVVDIRGSGPEARVEVEFPEAGKRRIVARYLRPA